MTAKLRSESNGFTLQIPFGGSLSLRQKSKKTMTTRCQTVGRHLLTHFSFPLCPLVSNFFPMACIASLLYTRYLSLRPRSIQKKTKEKNTTNESPASVNVPGERSNAKSNYITTRELIHGAAGKVKGPREISHLQILRRNVTPIIPTLIKVRTK